MNETCFEISGQRNASNIIVFFLYQKPMQEYTPLAALDTPT